MPAKTDMAARRIVADVDHFTFFSFAGDLNQLPSIPPGIEGFQVDLCMGSSSGSIPLKVPPGTAGLTPQLELRYNAGLIDTMNAHWIQDGNNTGNENTRTRLQASPIGFGWSLNLGNIIRVKPLQDGQPWRFFLALNGQTFELAYVDGTTYRTKPDEYMRVRKLTGAPNESVDHEYWVVETKDGTEYRFGYGTNSEQIGGIWQDSVGRRIAWQWNLDRIKDTHGNTIEIEYDEVRVLPYNNDPNDPYDQAAYPLRIKYTGNAGQGFVANREITFVYSSRTDHATHSGYTYTQYYWKKKLDRIEMRVGGALARTYECTYAYKKPYWHKSGQDYVQELGLDKLVLTQLTEKDASGNALPVTTYTYREGQIPSTNPVEYYRLQLAEMANGYGGKTTFTYEGHTPDGWSSLRRRYRVKQQLTDTGMGTAGGKSSTITRTYSYGPGYYVPDSYDFRGHGEATVTDSEGYIERSLFYTRDAINGKNAADVEVLQSRRYKFERWKSGGQVLWFTEDTDWSYAATQGGANFVKMDAVREYQGNVSRKTTYEYDAYGNLFRIKEYESTSAADGDFKRNTRRWYIASVNNDHYIVGKLALENVNGPGPGDGNWERSTWYCYDGSYNWNNPIGSGQYGDDGSYRGRLTATRQNLDGVSSVDVSHGYNGYGNRTSATEYGVYGLLSGAIASGDPRTTTVQYETTYHTFPMTITNPLSHVESRSYDARWGKPTSITDPNGGVTSYSFDSFGRLLSVQGPEVSGPSGLYRRTTNYTYVLPATANGRTTTQLVTQVRTDLGGASQTWLTTRRFYDGIGRVVQEYTDAWSGHNAVNSYFDARGLKWKESVPHTVSGTGLFLDSDWANYAGAATTYSYDELRRPTITTLPDNKTTEMRYQDWDSTVLDQNKHAKRYGRDALGRLVRVTEYTGADPNLVQYAVTNYSYDALDRLTSVTDNASNGTTLVYDKVGRKTSMTDPDMGSWSYDYDPIGTLKWQRDAKNQYVYFYYDNLKRMVRKWCSVAWTQETITAGVSKPTVYDLMEVRAAVDVNRKAAGLSAASWTDAAIVAGTGAKVRAVHFTELRDRIQDLWTQAGMGAVPQFTGGAITAGTRTIKASDLTDLRNWLVQQYENSAYGQTKRARAYYEYDGYDGTTQWGKGRRTAMWDVCGRQSFWWDKAGRMTKEERVIDGTVYTTQWTYDARDLVYQLTYPDGEVLTHSYITNGLLSQITSSLGTTYVSGAQYNALNMPTRYVLGNGTTPEVRHTYYGPDVSGSPYGALKTIQLQQGTNPMLVNRDIGYDFVGNVTSINDLVNSENVSYTYDELDRLLTASAPLNETYAYNQIGNITSKNGQTYQYGDAAHRHAVTNNGAGTSYGYDTNGCMTSRGSQTIKYDPETRPVRVDSGGSAISRFAYDGDSLRRKRLDTNGTIHYVGRYERNVGNGAETSEKVSKYYYATFGNVQRLVAFRRNGVLYWVGTDHLGGTIRVADGNFVAVDQMRYKAFGESRDAGSTLNTDRKFTGQTEDAAIGLYSYASRAYDPAIGRFVVPDSVVPGAGNPQALNRFSYTLNNPLKYADPTGHWYDDEGNWYDDEPAFNEGDLPLDWWVDSGDGGTEPVETIWEQGPVSVVDAGSVDDEINQQLMGVAEALDWADLTLTGTTAIITVAATALAGPAGTLAGEALYNVVSPITTGLDFMAFTAIAIADYRAGRTAAYVDNSSIDIRVGGDTIVSGATLAGGVVWRDVFGSTAIDAGQVAYDRARAGGLKGYSLRVSLSR